MNIKKLNEELKIALKENEDMRRLALFENAIESLEEIQDMLEEEMVDPETEAMPKRWQELHNDIKNFIELLDRQATAFRNYEE